MANSYLTKTSAVKHLATLFGEAEEVSPAQALANAGRKPGNRSWLSYMLTAMAEYDLFNREYERKGGRLVKMTLTEEGRKALGRDGPDNETPEKPRAITPESVLADVNILAKQNPSFRVGLIFEPKESL